MTFKNEMTDLRQVALVEPAIGVQICELMLANERNGEPTIYRELKALGVATRFIDGWKNGPMTNGIDVRGFAAALYEHCWMTRSPYYKADAAERNLEGALDYIAERLARHKENPVPCPFCESKVGMRCQYGGLYRDTKHASRVMAMRAANERELVSA